MDSSNDEIRLAALAHCRWLVEIWERAVPGGELAKGFIWRNEHVHLLGPQGIFKPRQMEAEPLTLKSTLESVYADEAIVGDDVVFYDYAPEEREFENQWTRSIVGRAIPVIYLNQVCDRPSEYDVITPMFVVGDDRKHRKFVLSTDADRTWRTTDTTENLPLMRPAPARAYSERTLRQRLHQAHFRKDVLAAYRTRCSVCELRIRSLLDGAHILPDTHPRGEPVVENGLSMCALHHRAFDRNILRVTPDCKIHLGEVRISEGDRSAVNNIRGFEGKKLWVPANPALQPDPERLRARLELPA